MSDSQWDFYPCRVDDAPASIFLDLQYEDTDPPSGADTVYWVVFKLVDAGEHGMGVASEADAMHPIEDAIVDRARALGLIYVGRLRHDGSWRLTLYGAKGKLDELRALANESGRPCDVRSKPDPTWEHYRDFLLPDAERWQWMQNRRLVGVLEDHGDPLDIVRRVDHWLYFATAKARTAFVDAAKRDGFALESAEKGSGENPFGAQIHRADCVELEHIHEVVMTLSELAEEHDGSYDGWETSVEKAPD